MSLDWTHGDLCEGLRCFHSGAFFEAHEHWESVWLATQEPERTFLQGLIQVAASFHHFQRGNCVGTISLLRSALRRLDGYPETFAGIAVAPLRAAVRLWLAALETVPQSSPPPLPSSNSRKEDHFPEGVFQSLLVYAGAWSDVFEARLENSFRRSRIARL
jgi:hypothetical protein